MSSTKNMKTITSSKKASLDSSEQIKDMPASVYEAAGEISDAVQLVIDEAKNMHAAKRAREAVFSDDEDVSDLRPDAKPFIPKEDPRYKTAMCFNKACPHGDKCTFAHSEDELRKRMCIQVRLLTIISIVKRILRVVKSRVIQSRFPALAQCLHHSCQQITCLLRNESLILRRRMIDWGLSGTVGVTATSPKEKTAKVI